MQYFKLSSAIIIEVKGPDCLRYLNARLTNDIKSLPIGSACFAACLSAQGRSQGLFTVLKLEDQRVILICDGGDKETVISAFRQFIVADRVEVVDLSEEFDLCHQLACASTEEFCLIQESDKFLISRYRSKELGTDILSPKNLSSDLGDKLTEEQATLLRLKSAIPSFPQEINDSSLFVESGLLKAISQTKGCYTGQEVVEKILSHAKAPQVLRAVRFKSNCVSETELSDAENQKIGKVLTAAYDSEADETYLFARVKNDEVVLSNPPFIADKKGEWI